MPQWTATRWKEMCGTQTLYLNSHDLSLERSIKGGNPMANSMAPCPHHTKKIRLLSILGKLSTSPLLRPHLLRWPLQFRAPLELYSKFRMLERAFIWTDLQYKSLNKEEWCFFYTFFVYLPYFYTQLIINSLERSTSILSSGTNLWLYNGFQQN